MTRSDDLIAFCDLCLNYLVQEKQMYLARLEHYPEGIHGVEALKGGLQAIDGCIDRINYKRGEFVEQKRQYIENSEIRRPRLPVKKVAKW